MTPASIIQLAKADGVKLALSPTGSIKAIGQEHAVRRWLPVLREHKADLLDELRAANDRIYGQFPESAVEIRRQRVLAMLRDRPTLRYAVVTDTTANPDSVIVALAIRGRGTCELLVPRDRYDGTLLLNLIERHGGTVH
jgi:hypothetical protein